MQATPDFYWLPLLRASQQSQHLPRIQANKPTGHLDLLLRLRKRRLSQHHPVLADTALLRLPGVGQPVCGQLQRR